jgi:hypothetical protein
LLDAFYKNIKVMQIKNSAHELSDYLKDGTRSRKPEGTLPARRFLYGGIVSRRKNT